MTTQHRPEPLVRGKIKLLIEPRKSSPFLEIFEQKHNLIIQLDLKWSYCQEPEFHASGQLIIVI